jgi:predicted branched-subunit amino acid permease
LYHEVISNFRDIRHELYGAKIDDYLQSFPRRDVLSTIIRDEVF